MEGSFCFCTVGAVVVVVVVAAAVVAAPVVVVASGMVVLAASVVSVWLAGVDGAGVAMPVDAVDNAESSVSIALYLNQK